MLFPAWGNIKRQLCKKNCLYVLNAICGIHLNMFISFGIILYSVASIFFICITGILQGPLDLRVRCQITSFTPVSSCGKPITQSQKFQWPNPTLLSDNNHSKFMINVKCIDGYGNWPVSLGSFYFSKLLTTARNFGTLTSTLSFPTFGILLFFVAIFFVFVFFVFVFGVFFVLFFCMNVYFFMCHHISIHLIRLCTYRFYVVYRDQF